MPAAPPPPRRAPAGARGLPLVQHVIAEVAGERAWLPVGEPAPLERSPAWTPRSPSLDAWLAFDARFLAPTWTDAPVRLPALVDRVFDGEGHRFRSLAERWLPARCALLPGVGAETLRFLYLGAADGRGEWPVLAVELADAPRVVAWAPGFDVWLAEEAGVIQVDRESAEPYEDPAYARALSGVARHLLRGGALEADELPESVGWSGIGAAIDE